MILNPQLHKTLIHGIDDDPFFMQVAPYDTRRS